MAYHEVYTVFRLATTPIHSLSLGFPHIFTFDPLPAPYTFCENSKSCLFPWDLMFCLVMNEPKFFQGCSSKSSTYFTRLLRRCGEHRKIILELSPPQTLRFQPQAGKLEARETGDEHAHHLRSERETAGDEADP